MENLGINPTYLITQVINFAILLFVLKKLVYKPILKMLEERKKKIEQGLKLTEEAIQEKEKLEKQKEQVIAQARKEANAIVDKVRLQAKKTEEELLKQAREKVEAMMEKGKKDLKVREKEMEEKLVKETVDIAVSLTEKLIGEVMDKKKQEILLKKRIARFVNKK